MDKYLIKKRPLEGSSMGSKPTPTTSNQECSQPPSSSSKKVCSEFQIENLILDPGLRPSITSYHVNNQDRIRRVYLQKGHC